MYLRQINRPQGIYLAIQESYYDREKRQSRTRTVQSLGYLEKLKAQYDDPVAYFTQYARELTEKNKTEKSADIAIDLKSTMEIGTNDVRNVGYGILKSLYKDLEIDKFWNWKTRGRKMKFSTDQITKLLTFSRALNPGSKRYTLNSSDFFFQPFDDCSLDDIYHALDIIADNKDDLQKWVYEKSQKICKRDMSVSYFDCTNYYFDISRPDVDSTDDDGNPIDENGNPTDAGYRKRGP